MCSYVFACTACAPCSVCVCVCAGTTSALRDKVGATFPGYMIHESAAWSDALNKWVFLPRRISSEKYDDVRDEKVREDATRRSTPQQQQEQKEEFCCCCFCCCCLSLFLCDAGWCLWLILRSVLTCLRGLACWLVSGYCLFPRFIRGGPASPLQNQSIYFYFFAGRRLRSACRCIADELGLCSR